MNRVVKAFLAIAVAIIYPSFVFLAVVTFLPDKAADMPKAPDYPRSPSCSRYTYHMDFNGITIGLDVSHSCRIQS